MVKAHVESECQERGIVLQYKSLLGEGFGPTLPSLSLARDQHNKLVKGKV
jgi:hypothetical protein